jgi:hypothetical protein
VLNAVTLIGIQTRGEWLGFLIGFVLWGIVTRRVINLIAAFTMMLALLYVGFVTDIHLPGAATRGGDVRSRDIAGRIIAPMNPELAAEYTDAATTYAGTVTWRTEWWRAIWDRINVEDTTALFGLGYGYPLGDLVPYLQGEVIRTPHNIFFYVLGYSGWLGVLIFFWLQTQLGLVLWRVLRITGQPFGVIAWVQTLTGAFFGNVFETPAWAIPIYILLGMAMAPLNAEETRVDSCAFVDGLQPLQSVHLRPQSFSKSYCD